jgi:hypothetical protein
MKTQGRDKRSDVTTNGSGGLLRRKIASWLGLVVLAFNVLGPGAMPANAAGAGTAAFAQGLNSDRIVVCTAAGMVVMDRDGNILDEEAGAAGGLCVFCLPLMHGTVHAAAHAIAIAVDCGPKKVVGPHLPFTLDIGRPANLAGASSPRAPPLS